MDDLSVWRVLGEAWRFAQRLLDPVFAVIGSVPWEFGDWTIFTAVALPLLGGLVGRVAGIGIGGLKLALAGFLLGGIIEHFQPFLERCLSGAGCH